MALASGTKLGPYEILAPLGAGGMGEVYRARDSRLGREVAVKILPSELAQDPLALERFQREARAASALNHPNIAVIHDLGEELGLPYLVLELLEGQTLRERIAAAPFELQEMLELGTQISDALDAAHSRGIVHRDIKPSNLFLTARGQIKILDFGLAKMVSRPQAQHGAAESPTLGIREEHLTSPGMALGTVAYMSPEQARGEDIDARSDLFSFGAVLYEMATRRQAFAGDTSALIFDAILNRAPLAATEANRKLPEKLDEIISKLLEKDFDLRYQSASGVRADLKRLKRDTESGRVAQAAAPQKASGPRSGATRAVGKTIDSLAVLPFENASGDPANDYLSEGITETIINSLSKLPKIRVVPRGIVFRYKGKNVDAFTAAGELHVRAVVSGRVLQHKDTLIVKAELVDVVKQDQLWGDQYNRKMADLLEVQEEIAGEIARHLQQKLGGEPARRAPQRATVNPEAYRFYLQGIHQAYQWRGESLRLSIEFFQKAINLDSGHAPSHAGLAYALALMGFYGYLPSQQAYSKSEAAAGKALELDPSLAEPHVALGWVRLHLDHNASESLREFNRAIELRPDLAIAHHGLAIHLNIMRRKEEGLEEILKAVELDPLTALFQAHHGWILHCIGRDEEALQVLQSALEAHPNDYYILRILTYTCNTAGHRDLAIQAGEKAAALTTNKQVALGHLAFSYAAGRDTEKAENAIRQILAEPKMDSGIAFYLGLTYSVLSRQEDALRWLEKSFEEGIGLLTILGPEPAFDGLRAHPRFQVLLQKLGIA